MDYNNYFPERTIEDVGTEDRCPYQSLIQSLFHVDDETAAKLKKEYLDAYPFMDPNIILNW